MRYAKENKIRKKHLDSLIGKLSFATCVVPARPFLRRLINISCITNLPYHYIQLTRSTLNDIQVWIDFMNSYNGITFFRHQKIFPSDEINMYSDASSIAFGATYGKQWIQAKWPPSWKKFHISVLELYPIFVLISIFAPLLRNSNILFHSDNSAVVTMINKQTSKNKPAMAILRKLVLTLMQFNVSLRSEHIPGTNNVLADHISRLQVTEQLLARYGMRLKPSTIPEHLLPKNFDIKC